MRLKDRTKFVEQKDNLKGHNKTPTEKNLVQKT